MTNLSKPSLTPLLSAVSPIALALSLAFSGQVVADPSVETIKVIGSAIDNNTLGSADQLLKDQGVDFSAAGGVSKLPVMHGLMGDRVKVLLDGADVTAACANQMNPPLSYVSASQIKSVSVIAGISPVSRGGDNIAGVIRVNTIHPQFGQSDQLSWQQGSLGGEYHSVNDARLMSLDASIASKDISLSYSGAFEQANSYYDGAGNKVLDTLYKAQNHALTAAFRDDKQQLAVKLSHQYIPYQGYPNQYMDMTNNRSFGLVSQYQRQLDNGLFEGQINWHQVRHEMGFFSDEKPGMMPMNTKASDLSYQLKWTLPVNADNQLLIGQEYYLYKIDDWWPAVAGSMMMGPNEYININDGKRQRLAGYIEAHSQLKPDWQLISGVRIERVSTNAGPVQAYNTMPMMGMPNMDAAAAEQFNATDRQQTDTNVDISLLSQYAIDNNQTMELGISRKNRSPNMYERYSWGMGNMAATMIGWFGDGNGYVGNVNLKAETANTISASYQYSSQSWQLTLSPYYTRISDYIDVTPLRSFSRTGDPAANRNILKFTNVDATLYGIDINGAYQLAESDMFGQLNISASLSTVHGERDDSHQPLYQIKPLQGKLAVNQNLGEWQNSLTLSWVEAKQRIDPLRLENRTAGYALLDISSRRQWQQLSISLAINNLLDRDYQLPLGGVNVAAFKAGQTSGFDQLHGPGRSVNVGLRYQF